MTKQTQGDNRNGGKGDPNRDVQPWLGWIAALLVVVIVVIAVAMGMERTNSQRENAAEVRMTPLVGGMEVPVATEGSSEANGDAAIASEVTPIPESISATNSISMVTIITTTSPVTDEVTGTGLLTETGNLTFTEALSPTLPITGSEATTGGEVISTTEGVSSTLSVTVEATATFPPTVIATLTPEASAVATATVTSTATPRPSVTTRPTATARPRATASEPTATLEVGDTVVAGAQGVEVYADTSDESLVLDSYGSGIELEVLDPSGDFESYPVVIDGESWVRVRAEDGLAGWAKAEQLEAE